MAIMRSTEARALSAMSRGTSTTSVPSRSERSSFSGVIIFMYLHTAARFTGSKMTSGFALGLSVGGAPVSRGFVVALGAAFHGTNPIVCSFSKK